MLKATSNLRRVFLAGLKALVPFDGAELRAITGGAVGAVINFFRFELLVFRLLQAALFGVRRRSGRLPAVEADLVIRTVPSFCLVTVFFPFNRQSN